MYKISCDVVKDCAHYGCNDYNYIDFFVHHDGHPAKNLILDFKTNGHAKLLITRKATDHNGRCAVIITDEKKEDVSVKATISNIACKNFQYGIVSFI